MLRLCIRPRAWPVFALAHNARFFAPDRELVRAVAPALSMAEVKHAIDDYWAHPANQTWLRRVAGWRMSTQSLCRIARDFLPLALPKVGRPPLPPPL